MNMWLDDQITSLFCIYLVYNDKSGKKNDNHFEFNKKVEVLFLVFNAHNISTPYA